MILIVYVRTFLNRYSEWIPFNANTQLLKSNLSDNRKIENRMHANLSEW